MKVEEIVERQRKQKQFKPQTGASLILWASEAQENIANIINPIMLEFYQKKNLRSLSNAESKELENLKAEILFGLKPFCTINSDHILEKISKYGMGSLKQDEKDFLDSLSK